MDITIRKAAPEDTDSMYRVYHESWMATYPNKELGITETDIEEYIPKILSDSEREKRMIFIRDMPDNRCNFVAECDGRIVGVCGGVKADMSAQLKSIYVLPQYQGKGIGLKLWETFRSWTGKTPKFIVHVATYNDNAIAFYKKIGFVDTGKLFTEERFKFKSGASIPETEMVLNHT